MVFKTKARPAAGADGADVELMEELVRKSLQVNPSLKDGKSTGQVIDDLRSMALERSARHGGPGGQGGAGAARGGGGRPEAPADERSERRVKTISFFLLQKQEELAEQEADLAAQERALAKRRQELTARLLDEVAEFFGLMAGGAESPEARTALRQQRAFIEQLGVSEADLARRARRKGER